MGMVQYGLTPRWTVGFMLEGQQIFGLPLTCGGLRINSYFRVFPHDDLLHFTLYGEYEGLNGAALFKMEVAGFGGQDQAAPVVSGRDATGPKASPPRRPRPIAPATVTGGSLGTPASSTWSVSPPVRHFPSARRRGRVHDRGDIVETRLRARVCTEACC
jgi:hypothetical protein